MERNNSMEDQSDFCIALVFQSGVMKNDKSYANLENPSLRICDDSSIIKTFIKAAFVCESMEESKVKSDLIKFVEESIDIMKASCKINSEIFTTVIVYPPSPSILLRPELRSTPLPITGSNVQPSRQFLSEISSENIEIRHNFFDRLRSLGRQLLQMRCCMRLKTNIDDEVLVPIQILTLPPASTSSDFLQVPIQNLLSSDHVVEESDEFHDKDLDTCKNNVRNIHSATCALRLHEEETITKHQSQMKKDEDQSLVIFSQNQQLPLLPLKLLQSVSHPRSTSINRKLMILEIATAIGLSICKAFLTWKNKLIHMSESSAPEKLDITHFLPSSERKREKETLTSPLSLITTTNASIDYKNVDSMVRSKRMENLEIIEENIFRFNEIGNDKILEQLLNANKRILDLSIPSMKSESDGRQNKSERTKNTLDGNLIQNERISNYSKGLVEEGEKETDNLNSTSSSNGNTGLIQYGNQEPQKPSSISEFEYDKIFTKKKTSRSGKSIKSRIKSLVCATINQIPTNDSRDELESEFIAEHSLTFTGSNPLKTVSRIGNNKIRKRIMQPSLKRKNFLFISSLTQPSRESEKMTVISQELLKKDTTPSRSCKLDGKYNNNDMDTINNRENKVFDVNSSERNTKFSISDRKSTITDHRHIYEEFLHSTKEPLLLQSDGEARRDQYRAVDLVLRANEMALWAIFAQYPNSTSSINSCVNSASINSCVNSLEVEGYSDKKLHLTFTTLLCLFTSFGICPAICSKFELLEHLQEVNLASEPPPSPPFYSNSLEKSCSFKGFIKILVIIAFERIYISTSTANNTNTKGSSISFEVHAQMRFAMLLHQMDISEGRAKLTHYLMKRSNNQNSDNSFSDESDCSPPASIFKLTMEPLLPLPQFDLSILKVARPMLDRNVITHDSSKRRNRSRRRNIDTQFTGEVTSGIRMESSSSSENFL